MSQPPLTLFTPGRVNLIGEHIDYNGGQVLPMALAQGVSITIARAAPGRAQISSTGFGSVDRPLGDALTGHWSDHALASLQSASEGTREAGYAVTVDARLPHGSGLSSSAAIIVGLLRAVAALEGETIDPVAIALQAQRVENERLGVPCGIMDQMAVAALQPGECMLLDTASCAYQRMAIPDDWAFVVHHSGVHRQLGDGRYAERRAECEAAAALLGVEALCDASADALEQARPKMAEAVYRRARHAISEQARVEAAVAALDAQDASYFGALMQASHASLRDDFAVSHAQVDALVAGAMAAGATGSRITGGGFGGCIVSLVATAVRDAFVEQLAKDFPEAPHIA